MREPVKDPGAGKGDKLRKGFNREAFDKGIDRIDWSASSCKHEFRAIYRHPTSDERCTKCGRVRKFDAE